MQVHCKICKRNGGTEDSFVQRFQTGNMFTHHQKSVILDAAGLEGGPRLETEKLDTSKPHLGGCCVADTLKRQNDAFEQFMQKLEAVALQPL